MAATAKNPFTWVEIYVEDMKRAQKFYETVLQIEMIPMVAPGDFGELEMLSFPWDEGGANISGALCKMPDMKPGAGGTLVYFACEDCEAEHNRRRLVTLLERKRLQSTARQTTQFPRGIG